MDQFLESARRALPSPLSALVSLMRLFSNTIDGADMDAVRADDFHMLLNACHISHKGYPPCY